MPLASEGKLLSNKDSRNKSYVWCEVTESKLWTSLYGTVGWSTLQVLPYSPVPLIQTVCGSFNNNFYPKIEFCNYFALCPLLLHFSMLGSFPETVFVHLLPVQLLKCFSCVFFLISSVSPPDLDLFFHIELFDFSLLRFVLFQWGCDWYKWIFNFL